MNNPFDYIPSSECEEAFRKLSIRLEALKESENPDDVRFCQELAEGKMLGVLIAEDNMGIRHTLYAFSGQLGSGGFHYPGFVEPVFDYLRPDGYFKTSERKISKQNRDISAFRDADMKQARIEYELNKEILEKELTEFREKCRLSKIERETRRKSEDIPAEAKASMIRQSQFEKAELRRIKKRVEVAMEPFASKLNEAKERLDEMKERRRIDSESLQQWLFDNFKVMNARRECKSLSGIFAATSMKVPPSGAGECCAPKLLQAAYRQGLTPVAIAEYWYGKPKDGEVRRHGNHYPACRGKCLPVLGWMLQGLEVVPPLGEEFHQAAPLTPRIIYENEWFCVIDKPSGMLSVPGKGKSVSVQQWLEERYGVERRVKVAHRLDQDTSGLLIAAFGDLSFKVMQSCFALRKVRKTYMAVLEGDYAGLGIPRAGRISLPLSPDYLDRPRQCVDRDAGKEAITDYELTGSMEGRSRIMFHPLTGRTHQLRVHAASMEGLGMPIAGDRLYGKRAPHSDERLLLHACKVEFIFPIDGKEYSFESPAPF